jgi:hypothetical protein
MKIFIGIWLLVFPLFVFGQNTVKSSFNISYPVTEAAELSVFDTTTVEQIAVLQEIKKVAENDFSGQDIVEVIGQFNVGNRLFFFLRLKNSSNLWYTYNGTNWSRGVAEEWKKYQTYFNGLRTPEILAVFQARGADKAYSRRVQSAVSHPFVVDIEVLRMD